MVSFPITDPTWIFFVVLGIILLAPMLFERLRIPSIVGMILAGLLIGPHGLHVLERDASFELFGKVGIYYIMFLASLQMNMQDMRQTRWQAVGFGVLTFLIPMLLGVGANLLFLGTAVATSVLMAAMYASHTLISYPIVLRYGLARRQSVTLAVGGTVVADTLTLLVLAVVGGVFKEHTTGFYWLWLVVKIVLIGAVIVYSLPRMGRWFFRRFNDGVVQYIFVLALVFLAAGLMEIVGMEGILGAFLAGIVLNKQIPATSPLMNHIEFIGNALFIPYFLIGVGMLINVHVLLDLGAVKVAVVMVLISIVSKWLAAFAAQQSFRLGREDRALIFGLTSSRAAATLAIVMVGYQIYLPNGLRLFGEDVLNGTMILILATCIVSSFVTESTSRRIATHQSASPEPVAQPQEDRLVVAVSNPATMPHLVSLALMLRTPRSPLPLNALNIVLEGNESMQRQGKLVLEQAANMAAAADVRMQTHCRWGVNVVSGIRHTMRELDASDLVIGLHQKERLFETFYGKLTTDLLGAIDRQVIIYRATMPLNTIRRLHLVVPARAEYEPGFGAWMRRIDLLAAQLSTQVEVYASPHAAATMRDFWVATRSTVKAEYHDNAHPAELFPVARDVKQDHLAIFVMARPGTLSYHAYLAHLSDQIERFLSARSLMFIYPAQPRGFVGKSSVLITQ